MHSSENRLLASLPRADRVRLWQVCVRVPLTLSNVLFEAGHTPTSVYFPIVGFISMVRPVDRHSGVEMGLVGREGMVGAQTCLAEASSQMRALVQGSGTAHRVDVEIFRSEMATSAALRTAVHRYLHVVMEQLATSAACLRFHLIGPRLARWLLMCQDRSQTDSFEMTQEFMSYMLGVRRVGVTAAALALQRRGLIAYHRGALTVLDRVGLEAAACSCYALDQQAYASLL